jgi:glycine cleavage system H protein
MDVDGCPLPDDRGYDLESDVWARDEPESGTVAVGLMAPIVSFAGKFTVVTFRDLDGPQPRGRSVATVESVRFTGAVRLPFAATVVARNDALPRRPKLLNDAPYSDGWVVRVRPEGPGAVAGLAGAGAVADGVHRKVREMRIHCLPAAPDVEMFEIGAECQAILVRLDEELARLPVDDVVHLVTDDATAPIEMVRWSDRSGYPVLHAWAEDHLRHFLVRKVATPTPRRRRIPPPDGT